MLTQLRSIISNIGDISREDLKVYKNAVGFRKRLKQIVVEVAKLKKEALNIARENNPKIFKDKV